MKFSASTSALIIACILVCLYIYHNSEYANLKCIISDVDGNKYCVRERRKLELAADRLAYVNQNMQSLVEHCRENFGNQENVKVFVKNYNPKKYMKHCLQVSTLHTVRIKEKNGGFV